MSQMLNQIQRFLDIMDEMTLVFNSTADAELKYDVILALANECREIGFDVKYWDPDASYEEDTRACYNAFFERARQYRLAYNLPDSEDN